MRMAIDIQSLAKLIFVFSKKLYYCVIFKLTTMLFNRLTAFVCGIAICTAAASQGKEPKVKFGDIKPEDFKPEYYPVDSSADAVCLYDVGSSHHEGTNSGWFSVVFKVHERIRLMHKKSFDDLATIKIPLFK